MNTITIETLAKYEDQYIALSENSSEILATGKTIKHVEEKLKKKNVSNATIRYVPPLQKYLSPVCL